MFPSPVWNSSDHHINMYKCDLCGLELSRKHDLNRHNKTVHGNSSYKCGLCEASFKRKDTYKSHHREHHNSHPYEFHELSTSSHGSTSQNIISPELQLSPHQSNTSSYKLPIETASSEQTPATSSEQSISPPTENVIKKKRTHRKIFDDTARIIPLPSSTPPLDIYLESQRTTLTEEVREMLELHRAVRFYVTIQNLYVRPDNWTDNGLDMEQSAHHTSNVLTVLLSSDLQELIDETFKSILNKVEIFLRNGSGWVIGDILPGELFIGAYRPLERYQNEN